jgi:hypothetical chaperone protein
MGISVGIDFGTSNSGVALFDGRDVHLLPVDQQNLIPEVVKTILYITKDHKAYIGQEAVALYYQQNVNRQRRFVRKWAGEIDVRGADMHYVDDVYVLVDELKPGRLLQFIKTALRSEGYKGTWIFDRYYTVAEIVAAYLGELKRRAEKLLGDEIAAVTLGRPVQFSPKPEQDRLAEETLRQAALSVGFPQVDFEYEPVAAALFYERTLTRPQNALIFDFGGGTLDITILRLGDSDNRPVYANRGIGIAGSDFDRTIIQKRMLPHFGWGKIYANPEIQELIHAVSDWMALPDLSTPLARGRLHQAIRENQAPVRMKALESLIFNDLAFTFYNMVEGGKIALSEQGVTALRLDEKDLHLWELYTRTQFERDIHEYVVQIEAVLLEAVAESGLQPDEIDVVVKTGGSSNVPVFAAMLEKHFGPERVKSSNLFSSVTAGLAIRAHQRA